jgi:glucose-1-phosphatase
MDPVFNPQLTFVSPDYNADATAQLMELHEDQIKGLEDNYRLLEDVIDMEDSKAMADGSVSKFRTDDTEIILEKGKEPDMKGSLKTGCSVADALVLQYFEEADPVKAAFGHELTYDEWKKIGRIKDVFCEALYSTPLIASNIANPLLKKIESELTVDGRVFTFLCGHDSNIVSVLAAMGAKENELPGAIEATPIGSKIVFSRFKGPDGGSYISVDHVYQTTEQLRGTPLLDLDNPPVIVPVSFSKISPNKDGLYAENDFMGLLRDSIDEYDRIVEKYTVNDTQYAVEEKAEGAKTEESADVEDVEKALRLLLIYIRECIKVPG